jgi:hypothetical protein
MLTNYSKQEEPAAALEQSASKNAVVTEKLDLIQDPTRIKGIIPIDDNTMILKFTAIGQLPVIIKFETGFTGQGHAYIRKINVQGPFVLQGQTAAQIRPIILNNVQDAAKGLRKEAPTNCRSLPTGLGTEPLVFGKRNGRPMSTKKQSFCCVFKFPL